MNGLKRGKIRVLIPMIYPGVTFLLLAVFRFLYYGSIKNIVTTEYDYPVDEK